MAEEDHTAGDGSEPAALDNVVQFPRDWFGPIEDLIPFGPDHESAGATEPKPPVEPTPIRPRGVTAERFWGADNWDGDWEPQATVTDERAAAPAEHGPAAAQTQQQSHSASGRNRARVLAVIAITLVAITGAALPRLTASSGPSAGAAPTVLADSSTTVAPETVPADAGRTRTVSRPPHAANRHSGGDAVPQTAPTQTTRTAADRGGRGAIHAAADSRPTTTGGGAMTPTVGDPASVTGASQNGTLSTGSVAGIIAAGSEAARSDYPAPVAPNPSYATAATP